MRAGAVVRYQVDDDPDLVRSRVLDQMVEVRHGPEQRIHSAVVADVVPAVGQRGRVEGRQPDGVDAEVGQVPQARPQPRQVAHAIAVRVGEAARVHLVDNRLLPPRVPVVAHVPPSCLMYRTGPGTSLRSGRGTYFCEAGAAIAYPYLGHPGAGRGPGGLLGLPGGLRARHAVARRVRDRTGALDRPAHPGREHPGGHAVPPGPAPPDALNPGWPGSA